MERSVIRGRLNPDYAALHPGYQAVIFSGLAEIVNRAGSSDD